MFALTTRIYTNISCMYSSESRLSAKKLAEHLPAHCLCSRPEMLIGCLGSPVHEPLMLGEGPCAALLDSCDAGAGDSSLKGICNGGTLKIN